MNNLKKVYFSTIDLQNVFSREFETLYDKQLSIKELNVVIADYIEYCNNKEHITPYHFVQSQFAEKTQKYKF